MFNAMAHEKAVKRFGVRYGRTVKTNFSTLESKQRSKHSCPYCKAVAVKRQSLGIWHCRKCSSVFSGKAYVPGLAKVTSIAQLESSEENENGEL